MLQKKDTLNLLQALSSLYQMGEISMDEKKRIISLMHDKTKLMWSIRRLRGRVQSRFLIDEFFDELDEEIGGIE